MIGSALAPATVQRFWAKVSKTERCWLWLAAHSELGYGRFYADGRTQSAHRVSWQLTNGAIPAGLVVCHRCDNPRCVNPSHLFLGSHRDNMADAVGKGRMDNPTAKTNRN